MMFKGIEDGFTRFFCCFSFETCLRNEYNETDQESLKSMCIDSTMGGTKTKI